MQKKGEEIERYFGEEEQVVGKRQPLNLQPQLRRHRTVVAALQIYTTRNNNVHLPALTEDWIANKFNIVNTRLLSRNLSLPMFEKFVRSSAQLLKVIYPGDFRRVSSRSLFDRKGDIQYTVRTLYSTPPKCRRVPCNDVLKSTLCHEYC